MSSNVQALEILSAGARALAHVDGLRPRLEIILGSVAEQVGAESAAIFVTAEEPGDRTLAASVGLSDAAMTGLVAAVRNPAHPIARTAADRVASFDVAPTAPGGPALRSHLPLTITRDGIQILVGVAAFAHEQPIGDTMRPLMVAGGDLAAAVIELSQPRRSRLEASAG